MAKIYCSVNGKKYKCLICRDYVTFIDAKDKKSFLTVDRSYKMSKVMKNSFFKRG